MTAAAANIRAQPSGSAPVLGRVGTAETLRLLGTSGIWYEVESTQGVRGFVFSGLVEVVGAAPPAAASLPKAVPTAARNPSSVTVDHKPVACMVAQRYPQLDACFLPIGRVQGAEIHFRAAESEPWYAVEMKPDGPCHSAFLPKPLAGTKTVQYYLSVVDAGAQETLSPSSAPGTPLQARVVVQPKDCSRGSKTAYSAAAAGAPLLVKVARDAAGRPLDAAARGLLQGKALSLSGFSSQGVAAPVTAVASAPATVPVSAASAAATTTGGAAAATGAGISTTTLVLAGAGVAVAAGGAVVLTNGDSAPDVTGAWTGRYTRVATCPPFVGEVLVFGELNCNFENDVALNLLQSGTSVAGSGTHVQRNTSPCGGFPVGRVQTRQLRANGSVSGDSVDLSLAYDTGALLPQLVGTLTDSTLNLSFNPSAFFSSGCTTTYSPLVLRR